jgi:hypothetical protein
MSEQVQHDSTTGEGSEESVFVDQYDWQDDLRGEKMERISASMAEMFLLLVAWISVVTSALFAVYEMGRVIVNGQ